MLRDFFQEYKKLRPEYTAFCFTDRETGRKRSVSKTEFLSDVAGITAFWRDWAKRRVLPKRSRIGILAENSYEYLLEYFGIILSGNTVVPLNQSFDMKRVADYARKARLQAMVLGKYLGVPEFPKEQLDLQEHCRECIKMPEDKLFSDVSSEREAEDTVLMLLSSGTSGESKVVRLSDRNLSAFAMDVIKKYHDTACGTVLCALPLYHIGGIIPVLEEMARGRSFYISSSKGILMDLSMDSFTRLVLVPAMAKKLLDRAESSRKMQGILEPVREMLCLGAAINRGLAESMKARGIAPLSYYGMTETTGTVSYEGEYKNGACGRVAEFCRVRIEDGEILVSGDNVTAGYLENAEETAAALRSGWLHTGDLGALDEDGYLHVTGRKKNTIILSNGENVSPEAMEAELYEMSKIRECIVYAKDDSIAVQIYAEEEDAGEIRTFIETLNQRLTMPERIRQISIQNRELPKNAMGKLDRNAFLRKSAEESRESAPPSAGRSG